MTRTNLLISPVGQGAFELCKDWAAGPRSYDIMFIFYDTEGYENFKSIAEYFVLIKGFKYPLIYSVLRENEHLLSKYKRFFFPDDDIRLTSKAIDQMFTFSEKHKISICQPSLYPKNVTWPITEHNPNTNYRFVSVVEIMCPLFSKDALSRCMYSFVESNSGWGLEAAWYRLLGSKDDIFVVNDQVVAIHEGVRGGGRKMYDNLTKMGISPDYEWKYLEAKYNWKIDFHDIRYVYTMRYLWNSLKTELKQVFNKVANY
jgi:hypothetical protein